MNVLKLQLKVCHIFQGIASSVEAARIATDSDSGQHQSFLLGAMDSMTMLDVDDQLKIANTLNVIIHDVLEFAFSSKKCYMSDKSFEGTVCSSGESVIVLIAQKEVVMKVDKFLSIKDNTESYKLLVKGNLYDYVYADNGQPVKQFWSGFTDVNSKPQEESCFATVDRIQRKVFLYSNCEASSTVTVVEYQRCLEGLPFDLVVPVFPEKGDMLLVQGIEVGDIWYGHVRNVDCAHKTVEIYFYIESSRMPNIFVRESIGRASRNTVPWDSLLGVADGQWKSPTQWQKTV